MFDNDYFTDKELSCHCCGVNEIKNGTLDRLISVRRLFDSPMIVTSGYRCEDHCNAIGSTQTHTTGQAIDIKILQGSAYELLRAATMMGFTGIGVSQRGAHNKRFMHLDDLPASEGVIRPTVWSY